MASPNSTSPHRLTPSTLSEDPPVLSGIENAGWLHRQQTQIKINNGRRMRDDKKRFVPLQPAAKKQPAMFAMQPDDENTAPPSNDRNFIHTVSMSPLKNLNTAVPVDKVKAEPFQPKDTPFPIVHQTVSKNRVERSRQRPTMGGKTVSSVKALDNAGSPQRLSTEQLKLLSRRINPNEPLSSPHKSPQKPVLPSLTSRRPQHSKMGPTHKRHQQPSRLLQTSTSTSTSPQRSRPSPDLFQTCASIWSDQPPRLGDFSHDQIKYLSDLLKVRLAQAKARVIAKMESSSDKPLANDKTSLEMDYEWLLARANRAPHRIKLSAKRHQPAPAYTSSVVGNGRNLFHKSLKRQRSPDGLHVRRLKANQRKMSNITLTTTHSGKALITEDSSLGCSTPSADKQSLQKSVSRRSKHMPVSRQNQISRQPKKLLNSTLLPDTLEDGSKAYLCRPCNKKYKNRNGLLYHLDRCKNREKEMDETPKPKNNEHEDGEDDSSATIRCICSTPNDDIGIMVQCDQCNAWLHLECVGVASDMLDDAYHCPNCVAADNVHPPASTPPRETPVKDTNDDSDEYDALFAPIQDPMELQTEPLWDDFLMPSQGDSEQPVTEAWPHMGQEDQLSSSYGNDPGMSSLSWGMSDLDLLQPPSLLFSDNTAIADTPSSEHNLPSSDIALLQDPSPDGASPVDSTWFQFANFDDDYHCDEL